jgi:hypothetical protein
VKTRTALQVEKGLEGYEPQERIRDETSLGKPSGEQSVERVRNPEDAT